MGITLNMPPIARLVSWWANRPVVCEQCRQVLTADQTGKFCSEKCSDEHLETWAI